MKKQSMRAENVMARHQGNPDWVRRMNERDKSRKVAADQLRTAEEPLIRDLAGAGIVVESVYDFINTKDRYDTAIPVLLKHFGENYPNRIREGIARSLGRSWARHLAWSVVLDAYVQEPNKARSAQPGEIGAPSGPKDGMAVALSHMAAAEDLDVLISLISDLSNGPSRVFFVQNLSRSKSRRAFDALAKLSNDPELSAEVNFRLKRKLRRQAKKDRSRSIARQ